MATEKLVAVKEFCLHHNIQAAFIEELSHHGIIEIVRVKRSGYIPVKNLEMLERVVRIYTQLDVNPPGIATILQLLSQLNRKEEELLELRNELEFYRTR